jgi:hypothetical protein
MIGASRSSKAKKKGIQFIFFTFFTSFCRTVEKQDERDTFNPHGFISIIHWHRGSNELRFHE